MSLGARGMGGDVEGMLGHSVDYLELASILVIGWMWTEMSARADRESDLGRGIDHAARYWIATEVPRIDHLARLCESAERSYLDVRPEWL